jgi:single-strand DNA-binding protein
MKEESMSTSAPNLNNVTLVGQLTGDRAAKAARRRSVCNLRIAVNDQREQPPLFVDIATFGAGAEACAEYLSKGRSVGVTGRLVLREWQAKDGSKRSKHSVVGRVVFGGKSDDVLAGEGAGDD